MAIKIGTDTVTEIKLSSGGTLQDVKRVIEINPNDSNPKKNIWAKQYTLTRNSSVTLPVGVASLTCVRFSNAEPTASPAIGEILSTHGSASIYHGDDIYWTATPTVEYNEPVIDYRINNPLTVTGDISNDVLTSGVSTGTRKSFMVLLNGTSTYGGMWNKNGVTVEYGDKLVVENNILYVKKWNDNTQTRDTATWTPGTKFGYTISQQFSGVVDYVTSHSIVACHETATDKKYQIAAGAHINLTIKFSNSNTGPWYNTLDDIDYDSTVYYQIVPDIHYYYLVNGTKYHHDDVYISSFVVHEGNTGVGFLLQTCTFTPSIANAITYRYVVSETNLDKCYYGSQAPNTGHTGDVKVIWGGTGTLYIKVHPTLHYYFDSSNTGVSTRVYYDDPDYSGSIPIGTEVPPQAESIHYDDSLELAIVTLNTGKTKYTVTNFAGGTGCVVTLSGTYTINEYFTFDITYLTGYEAASDVVPAFQVGVSRNPLTGSSDITWKYSASSSGQTATMSRRGTTIVGLPYVINAAKPKTYIIRMVVDSSSPAYGHIATYVEDKSVTSKPSYGYGYNSGYLLNWHTTDDDSIWIPNKARIVGGDGYVFEDDIRIDKMDNDAQDFQFIMEDYLHYSPVITVTLYYDALDWPTARLMASSSGKANSAINIIISTLDKSTETPSYLVYRQIELLSKVYNPNSTAISIDEISLDIHVGSREYVLLEPIAGGWSIPANSTDDWLIQTGDYHQATQEVTYDTIREYYIALGLTVTPPLPRPDSELKQYSKRIEKPISAEHVSFSGSSLTSLSKVYNLAENWPESGHSIYWDPKYVTSVVFNGLSHEEYYSLNSAIRKPQLSSTEVGYNGELLPVNDMINTTKFSTIFITMEQLSKSTPYNRTSYTDFYSNLLVYPSSLIDEEKTGLSYFGHTINVSVTNTVATQRTIGAYSNKGIVVPQYGVSTNYFSKGSLVIPLVILDGFGDDNLWELEDELIFTYSEPDFFDNSAIISTWLLGYIYQPGDKYSPLVGSRYDGGGDYYNVTFNFAIDRSNLVSDGSKNTSFRLHHEQLLDETTYISNNRFYIDVPINYTEIVNGYEDTPQRNFRVYNTSASYSNFNMRDLYLAGPDSYIYESRYIYGDSTLVGWCVHETGGLGDGWMWYRNTPTSGTGFDVTAYSGTQYDGEDITAVVVYDYIEGRHS